MLPFEIPFLENETGYNRCFVRVTGRAEVAPQIVTIAETVTVLWFNFHTTASAAIILFGHYHFYTEMY